MSGTTFNKSLQQYTSIVAQALTSCLPFAMPPVLPLKVLIELPSVLKVH